MPFIFFDFDNTLMETERFVLPSFIQRFNELYGAQIDHALTLEEFLEHFQGLARESLCARMSEHFNIHVDYAVMFHERDWFVIQYMQQRGIPMAPNVMEALDELRHHNATLSIVTNSTLPRCLSAMRSATNKRGEELIRHFGTRLFESGELQKPKPDVYLRAMQQLNATPEHSYAIEDSPTGARSAITAGLKTFGYVGLAEHPQDRATELTTLGVVDCFDDWADFPALLKGHINL